MLATTRVYGSATAMKDRRILLAGGTEATAEIFDPATLSSTPTTGQLIHRRYGHTAILLQNGKVLICGGENYSGGVSNTVELFDPATGMFAAVTSTMSVPRYVNTLTLLPDGRVLIAGGNAGPSNTATNTAEIFDPATETLIPVASPMNSPRYGHTATLLSSGQVLLAGGNNGTAVVPSAEVFDPTTLTFSALANAMTSPREAHTATILPNGKILIAGGDVATNSTPLNTAELFDPASATFTSLYPAIMTSTRTLHAAAALADGRVLLTGGYLNNQPINTAETYTGPAPGPVYLSTVVSRMTHGDAGAFDVNLPLSGNPGVECRSGGVTGSFTLIFTFANPLTVVGSASVSNGIGSIASSTIDPEDSHNYIVNLSGVSNAQFITVTLNYVGDSAGGYNSEVSSTMGALLGDTNGDGVVNIGDSIQVRSEAGNELTDANFREDVNSDGAINVGDTVTVRNSSGTSLPSQFRQPVARPPSPVKIFQRQESIR